jgi:hypothetical protein
MRTSLSLIIALMLSAPIAHAQTPEGVFAPAPAVRIAQKPVTQDATSQAVEALRQFAHEPSVLEVQEAASRYALVHPDTYRSWLSRAAWSNVLPERLTGEFQSTLDDDTTARTTASDNSSSDYTTRDLDEQLRVKVFAEWDLSRLIFDQDEYNAAKELSKIVTRREDLLTTINKLYFARRQLQAMNVIDPVSSARKALKLELQLAGLTADLDALTGGWFSRTVAQRYATVKSRPSAAQR